MPSPRTDAALVPKRTSRLALLAFACAAICALFWVVFYGQFIMGVDLRLEVPGLVVATLNLLSLALGLVSLIRIRVLRNQLSGSGFGWLAVALSLPAICFLGIMAIMMYSLAQHGY